MNRNVKKITNQPREVRRDMEHVRPVGQAEKMRNKLHQGFVRRNCKSHEIMWERNDKETITWNIPSNHLATHKLHSLDYHRSKVGGHWCGWLSCCRRLPLINCSSIWSWPFWRNLSSWPLTTLSSSTHYWTIRSLTPSRGQWLWIPWCHPHELFGACSTWGYTVVDGSYQHQNRFLATLVWISLHSH